MKVFLNGQIIAPEQAVVPVSDRSFRYGDGLFETVLVRNGKFFRFGQHWARLESGADFLRIRLNLSMTTALDAATHLLRENRIEQGLVRITVSRGSGRRGYLPSGTEESLFVITTDPLPALHSNSWKLCTSAHRVPEGDLLFRYKTANRLLNVLASVEANERGCDEALILNSAGFIADGASSNLFWIEKQTVCTPPLNSPALAGITRAAVIELCRRMQIPVEERVAALAEVIQAQGVFMTLTSRGVVEVTQIEGRKIRTSHAPAKLREEYDRLVNEETR